MTGILNLANEILLSICELICKASDTPRHCHVASLRLVCRRFEEVTSHLLLRQTTVDISRPETLRRLCGISENPRIAVGVREVYVRLHFYHPWIASTFDNFTASIKSEWMQRRERWWPGEYKTTGELVFNDIVCKFLDELEVLSSDERHCLEQAIAQDAELISAPWASQVLREAFQAYKTKSIAQDGILQSGNFAQTLAGAFSKLPKATHLMLYDGEMTNNFDPGSRIRVDASDQKGQQKALIKILSRPMLWEDARWVAPAEKIWPGVPLELLLDIPVAIGKLHGIVLDQLSINVSSAPDYTGLAADQERLNQLSVAATSMSLFQITFQPRCRSGCGPWAVDENFQTMYTVRSVEEIRAINQYLGALVNTKSMYDVNINLGEFWFSAGMESFQDAPASLGVDFQWPVKSELTSVFLNEVSMTEKEIETLAKSLCDEAELRLTIIFLRRGIWSSVLDTLRRELEVPREVHIRHPLGGGINELSSEQVSFVFDTNPDSSYGENSRADCYAKGISPLNPFELLS